MAEFNGFLNSYKRPEPAGTEQETQFLQGILSLLCNRPAEGYRIFSPLAKHSAAAAFNCALCFLAAKDYEHSLDFLEDAEKQLRTMISDRPERPIPSSLLQYEAQSDGYRFPMLSGTPKSAPNRTLKQILRVKADVLYALGRKEDLKKLLPLLSGEGYKNIEEIKLEMED